MPTKQEREARNAAERARYAALPDEKKSEILDAHKEWSEKRKETNPEAHAAAQAAKIEKQRLRYQTDPEYRERVKASQRAAQARAREKRRAEKNPAAAVAVKPAEPRSFLPPHS